MHLRLRAGAVATLLHVFRVLIFVIGRTVPWIDFDVRPEQRATHSERWTWAQVVFAAAISTFGVVDVLVVWSHGRSTFRSRTSTPRASICNRPTAVFVSRIIRRRSIRRGEEYKYWGRSVTGAC